MLKTIIYLTSHFFLVNIFASTVDFHLHVQSPENFHTPIKVEEVIAQLDAVKINKGVLLIRPDSYIQSIATLDKIDLFFTN